MTQAAKQNPVSRLLHILGEFAEEFGIKPQAEKQALPTPLTEKERAVRIGDIWNHVQKELDEMGGLNDYGEHVYSGYVMDVYLDNAGAFAIITKSDGKLYKVPVNIDDQSQITTGEVQEVVMEFMPVSRSLVVKRQADGKVRWFAAPACTAILNRSGEIDSRDLFDSFVEYINRTGDYPYLDFFHFGSELTLGRADLVFRDGVNYVASGLFDDSDIARSAIEAIEKEPAYWGLSIQYLPTEQPETIRSAEGVEIPVFRKGINHFISILPENAAAAILTNISTKEVNRMNKIQEEALKKLTGGDDALFAELADKLNSVNRTASDGKVITREKGTPAQSATPVAAKPAPKTSPEAAPVKREWTKDEIKELIGTDEFKSAMSEVFPQMQASEDEGDEPGDDAPVSEPADEALSSRATAEVMREILTEIRALREERENSVQQVLDDLPDKIAKTKIYRARATITPGAANGAGAGLDLADVAAKTLEKIGAIEE